MSTAQARLLASALTRRIALSDLMVSAEPLSTPLDREPANIRSPYHARRALIYDCDAVLTDFLNIVHEPLVGIDHSELPRCRSLDKIHTCLRPTALRRVVVQCIIRRCGSGSPKRARGEE